MAFRRQLAEATAPAPSHVRVSARPSIAKPARRTQPPGKDQPAAAIASAARARPSPPDVTNGGRFSRWRRMLTNSTNEASSSRTWRSTCQPGARYSTMKSRERSQRTISSTEAKTTAGLASHRSRIRRTAVRAGDPPTPPADRNTGAAGDSGGRSAFALTAAARRVLWPDRNGAGPINSWSFCCTASILRFGTASAITERQAPAA